MTHNTNPAEGGPSGGQLEAKIGAYYFLSMVAETEPRGLPGCTAHKVKFQRTYEGHALDDIIVLAEAADGETRSLEIQSKRTVRFTAGDPVFGKVIAQIVRAGEAHNAPVAVAIARTSARIERHYQQLLLLARKTSSADALCRALDAPRVVSQGMRDFAAAVRAHIVAAGAVDSDDALWRLLRRLEILVFDFESPGALSATLVDSLARYVLAEGDVRRHRDLWEALQTKALSYDADGGEITRAELIAWLRTERGLELRPGRDLKLARRRFGDASDAALAAIDDTIAGFRLDRSDRVLAAADQLDASRFLEIVGGPGCGKSAILKVLAEREGMEGRPLVLTPARTPAGGWIALSGQLGFHGSAAEFLTEMAASGCATLFIDSLDRVTDPGAQATIVDLVWAVAKVPAMRLAATVGPDFSDEQRAWLPAGAITILGHAITVVGALSDDEAAALGATDARLGQLLCNQQAKPLTRNLYQLRQLLGRTEVDLPLSEAALARSWWAAAPRLGSVQNRARQKALRILAAQTLAQATELDITRIDAKDTEDLVQVEDITEIFLGAKALFRHDILRDWAGANLLIEQPDQMNALPLSASAPTGLARAVEIKARWCAEQADGADQWSRLLTRVSQSGVHGSWRRAVLLALVRTEPSTAVLDRLIDVLQADNGDLLRDLIRITEAADSTSGVERFAAMGVDVATLPTDLRTPTGPSWARLMGWLLTRLDKLVAPIGPDLLRFFRLWLMAGGGRDAYAPLIVQTLYGWLIGLERQDRLDEAASFSRLFPYDGRYGRSGQIGQDIRALFLIFCGSRPDLADAYLRGHLGDASDRGVADEIFRLPQSLAAAAPAVMADFAIEALITAEERYEEQHGPRPMGRLSLRIQERRAPGPLRGPYLHVLRASKVDGLRLVRRIVDYGLGLDRPSNETVQQFELDLPAGLVSITAPDSYLVARSPGVNGVMASALRALEAWGHEQIERGEPVELVVADILGRDQAPIPAPMLAVVVDLLLSHLPAADPRLIPYMASAELLRLDFDRFNRDRTGVHTLSWEDDGHSGPGSNADLWARPSRQTCLQWRVSEFLFNGEAADRADLQARLQRQLDRFSQGGDGGPDGPYGLRWPIEHVLRLLDRANWREVKVELQDGQVSTGFEYVEPQAEASVMEALRASADSSLSETVVMSQLVEAALDPTKATEEVLSRGLEWAQGQDLAAIGGAEDDFTVAQRWRAVVAAAVLVLRSPGRSNDREWASSIVARGATETDDDHGSFGAGQVRYNANGLAVLGLAHLAISGEGAALTHLLDLATRASPAIVAAFGLVLDDLARWRLECPGSLLRLAIDASTVSVRDWEHPDRFEAAQARRAKRLVDRRSREERFLLVGGSEPDWPVPAGTRHVRVSRRLAPSIERADHAREVRERVVDRFNEQMAGAWLSLFENSPTIRNSDLPRRITDIYRAFSNCLWGKGLDADAEITRLPTEWLRPYARLRLRATCGGNWTSFKADFLDDVVALPDQGFLAGVEAVIPLADGLTLTEDRPTLEILVQLRELFCQRLKQCGVWQWRKSAVSDRIAHDLAGAVRALFVHSPYWFDGSSESRLPEGAVSFAAIFPALADLAADAPGLEYVATLMMNDFERGAGWAPAPLLLQVAEAWLRARGADTVFWRDNGFGSRVCKWLEGRVASGFLERGELTDRVQVLADCLAKIGVPEALILESIVGVV